MVGEAGSVGLKVGLFFLFSFLSLGQSLGFSLFLAILGGLAGGWIVASWHDAKTPNPPPEIAEPVDGEEKSAKLARARFKQLQKRRYDRRPSVFFWKNPQSSKSKLRR